MRKLKLRKLEQRLQLAQYFKLVWNLNKYRQEGGTRLLLCGELKPTNVKAWTALFQWSQLNRHKPAFCLESVLLHLNTLQVIYSFLFQATMMTFTWRYGLEVANSGTHAALQLW